MWQGEGAVTDLTAEECWEHLSGQEFGRLAVAPAGMIEIFPINFYTDRRELYLRTAPGTKLLALTVNADVAFEVDNVTETSAWSVVVKGTARQLERQSEIDAANELPLNPWIPTLKYHWVVITPRELRGRSFERGPEPERY